MFLYKRMGEIQDNGSEEIKHIYRRGLVRGSTIHFNTKRPTMVIGGFTEYKV